MLDIKFIKENRDIVESAIKNKKVAGAIELDELLRLYEKRKTLKQDIDATNQKRNEVSRERNVAEGVRLKEELKKLEEEFDEVDKKFIALMLLLPNIPSPDTPVGPDESGNQVIRQWGEKPSFDFTPKEHWQLGEELDVIDNERATKVSGPRFTYLKGDLAMLQFALLHHAFGILSDQNLMRGISEKVGLEEYRPFVPVIPPVLIKPAVMNRMARLEPKEERYHIDTDDLYLVGSAEHTLGPMHMDETFTEDMLPLRYAGYSTAFRREAGSYGKDMKGILRLHQFDKIEFETYCLPENSYKEQDFLVALQEHILQTLALPYQVVSICTGDMGLPDHRQMDIETWMPGQDKYRETHTSDLIGGFQPRRLNTRVKRKDGKTEHVHMNDATFVAIGRMIIAIMENFQQKDGSIKIPAVLQKYMGKEVIGKS